MLRNSICSFARLLGVRSFVCCLVGARVSRCQINYMHVSGQRRRQSSFFFVVVAAIAAVAVGVFVVVRRLSSSPVDVRRRHCLFGVAGSVCQWPDMTREHNRFFQHHRHTACTKKDVSLGVSGLDNCKQPLSLPLVATSRGTVNLPARMRIFFADALSGNEAKHLSLFLLRQRKDQKQTLPF